jgi:hypothetical protein
MIILTILILSIYRYIIITMNRIYKIEKCRYINLKNILKGGNMLPTVMSNDKIIFKNSRDEYVPLDDEFEIIFDTGNFGNTLIGENIVKKLGLHIKNVCPATFAGVIACKMKCGDVVKFSFKFLYPYIEPSKMTIKTNEKSRKYSVVGYVVSGGNEDKIIFGQKNGLNILFNDGYAIDSLYEKGSTSDVARNENKISAQRNIIQVIKIAKKIFDNIETKSYAQDFIKLIPSHDKDLLRFMLMINEIMEKKIYVHVYDVEMIDISGELLTIINSLKYTFDIIKKNEEFIRLSKNDNNTKYLNILLQLIDNFDSLYTKQFVS